MLLCRIWFVVLGFQRHWVWGCALLAPLIFSLAFVFAPMEQKAGFAAASMIVSLISFVVLIVFIIIGWPSTKSPLFWSIGSFVVAMLTVYGALFYAAAQVP